MKFAKHIFFPHIQREKNNYIIDLGTKMSNFAKVYATLKQDL